MAATKRRGATGTTTRAPKVLAEVQALIAPHPPAVRAALLELRRQILAAAPGGVDAVSYGLPTVKVGGKGLVAYAGFKAHCSLFPMSSGALASLVEELGERIGGRGTIHFTPEDPLPAALVKRIVKVRLQELAARAAVKKAAKRAP